MPRCSTCLPLTLALLAASLRAQNAPPPEPPGSVTGHIFCADTNEPARFARVYLDPVPPPRTLPAADPSQPTQSRPNPSTAQRTDTVMTTLDGSYTITKVHPGNYYLIVHLDGYIDARNLFTAQQLTNPTPADRDLINQKLTRVTVESNQTNTADLRLDRGAAVTGTVLYDDGSPAAGLTVVLLHKDKSGKWVELPQGTDLRLAADTDDRGNFRIASLQPGDYMLRATLALADTKLVTVTGNTGGNVMQYEMQSFRFALPFFGSGNPRIGQATGFTLRPGEEHAAQTMILPIAKLHKVTGRVLAGADAHPVNAATVALVDSDSNQELASTSISREDGLFHFEFVPDGDYILRVSDARDVVWEPAPQAPNTPLSPFPAPDKERVLARYGGVDQPLLLRGDLYGVLATVPAATQP